MMQCNVHYATFRLQVTKNNLTLRRKLQYLLLNKLVTRYTKSNLNRCYIKTSSNMLIDQYLYGN